MNYLDILPKELLAYLIPNDYVYTTLQIFNESDRYQIFVDFINLNYPDYYKISKRDSNLSFRHIMEGLYTAYIFDDINEYIDLIETMSYQGFDVYPDSFDWLHPIILSGKFPKVAQYYLSHEFTKEDYHEVIYNDEFRKKMFDRELFKDITIILISLEMDNLTELLQYGMSDKFKINLLKLSGIDLTKHSIATDDFMAILNTELGRYLSGKINLV
jgi:hypothetical protein